MTIRTIKQRRILSRHCQGGDSAHAAKRDLLDPQAPTRWEAIAAVVVIAGIIIFGALGWLE